MDSPLAKYRRKAPSGLPDRKWPSKTVEKAPRWLSTDLRDGNQSLQNPMTLETKWQFFKLLVGIGYKEIEVSFPCASETDFLFTRRLVETPGAVPDDVTLQVITQCKKEALRCAVDSLKGAKKAIIFTYIAGSDNFRNTMLGIDEEEAVRRVVEGIEYLRSITKDDPSMQGTIWTCNFGIEDFPNSRPELQLKLSEAAKSAWCPTANNPMILALGASVESFTPNVFADQVEFISRNISERETVRLSIHPHNDRGCAVAAAELSLLAGADRLEGCLFGNGERAGNVDLVTLAMNLYTQGIDPKLDFSALHSIRSAVEKFIHIPIHPRTPYAGDFYFRAFSGAHQDAIIKGFRKREQQSDGRTWQVPYLPMDPADVGLKYDQIIKINSQSGKTGVAWYIQQTLGIKLPVSLQISFSRKVKSISDKLGRELLPMEVKNLYLETYQQSEVPCLDHKVRSFTLSGIGYV